MKPYEEDISRVRAMYRIPTAPAPDRVLELVGGAECVLEGFAWPGAAAVTMSLSRVATDLSGTSGSGRLPFDSGSFDRVIAHRGFGSGADAVTPREVFRVLGSAGIFAFTACNASVAAWVRSARPTAGVNASRPSHDAHGCRTLLRGAGFRDIAVFTVVPHVDAPLRLIDTSARLSRVGFRRELEATRARLSAPAYLLRRAIAELALNRFLEGSLVAWGRKP